MEIPIQFLIFSMGYLLPLLIVLTYSRYFLKKTNKLLNIFIIALVVSGFVPILNILVAHDLLNNNIRRDV